MTNDFFLTAIVAITGTFDFAKSSISIKFRQSEKGNGVFDTTQVDLKPKSFRKPMIGFSINFSISSATSGLANRSHFCSYIQVPCLQISILESMDTMSKLRESRAAAPKGQCPVEHRGEFPDVLRGRITGLR